MRPSEIIIYLGARVSWWCRELKNFVRKKLLDRAVERANKVTATSTPAFRYTYFTFRNYLDRFHKKWLFPIYKLYYISLTHLA